MENIPYEEDIPFENEGGLLGLEATWVTREGRTIFIKDMETRHIINCMRMLERNANNVKDRALDMAIEAEDIDGMHYISEMDPLEFVKNESVNYLYLKHELEKRGVKYE